MRTNLKTCKNRCARFSKKGRSCTNKGGYCNLSSLYANSSSHL